MKHQYISQNGLQALQDQLSAYKEECNSLRAKLVELRQVNNAESFDLIDDALRLTFLEKEIERITATIARSKLLPKQPKDGTIQVGSIVRLQPFGETGEMSCTLVSSIEANPLEGRISDKSPLGIALLGKMKDAIVRVAGPRKMFSYRILGVDY